MANYLCLGTTNPNFRLGPTENGTEVLERIDHAWVNHDIAHVRAVLQDGIEPQNVSIDPSHCAWWSVLHVSDPDENEG